MTMYYLDLFSYEDVTEDWDKTNHTREYYLKMEFEMHLFIKCLYFIHGDWGSGYIFI